MDVTGKLVVMTGAARGMARAYAPEFPRPGAQVAVGDLQDSSAVPAAVYGPPGGRHCTTEVFGDERHRHLDVTLSRRARREPLRARDVVGAPPCLAGRHGRLTTEQAIMVDGGTVLLRTGAREPNGKDLK